MATIGVHKPLHCPLCFENFTTPRVLPCYHTFCEKCLGTHIKSQVQGGIKFKCPLCAAHTVPVDSKVSVDKWASAFPLNTLICSVLASSGTQGQNNCEACETDGVIAKAGFWCKDCNKKVCGSCKKLHKNNKLLKHHAIVSIDEMGQHQPTNFQFDQECCLHSDKVKLFCLDHRKPCCSVCVATDHRHCDDVRSIDVIVRDDSQRHKTDYPNIIRDIRKLKTKMEKIITEKKNNAKQVLEEKDQMIDDMNVRIDKIIERLNKARNIFRNDTERLYKETESFLLENEKKVQSFVTNVQNSCGILEIIEKSGTPQQQFTAFESFRLQISSHYCQLKLHLKDDTEVHFALNESKVLNYLEEPLDSLGTVEVSKNPSTSTCGVLVDTDIILKIFDTRTKIRTEMCAVQVEKQDLMSPIKIVQIITRETFGPITWFTGGTYTADGRLLMADITNNRLVKFDEDYNMVKEYKIDGTPTDVAAGHKDDEIYVAVSHKYIYKCTLHTHRTKIRKIKAPSDTWGIAVTGDNIVVSTDNAVVILTQEGSTVRSIPKKGTYDYIAVSQTQRTMYHKDNNDVVCRTWEGQEMFRYQNEQLQWPCGIDIDIDGNVYICGYNSHNLHQVSSDGQRSRIIQLHNISVPCSIVIHPHKREFVVTSWNEDTVCEVYKFGCDE